MSVQKPSPIFTESKLCLSHFDDLITLFQEQERQTEYDLPLFKLCDEHSRFRIWAGNIGALQTADLPSSLDARLQVTRRVQNQVVEFLQDLCEALQEARSIASGERPNQITYSVGAHEPSEWPHDGALPGTAPFMSEIKELFDSAADTITNLFRLSIVIRKATSRDRYAKAIASVKEPFDDRFDIAHVGQKFPRVHETAWLESRLGQAITRRRQYLRYCRDHRDKLSEDIRERSVQTPAVNLETRPSAKDKQSSKGVKSPVFGTDHSSHLALTAASTMLPVNLDTVARDSDDGQSQISYATSVAEENETLFIVRLADLTKKTLPFECPYCWSIQKMRSERAWRKHVLMDLRPYVCTFEECDLKMFADRAEWFNHELEHHRVEWSCDFCVHEPYQSVKKFEEHIRARHAQKFTDSQLPAIMKLSRRATESIPPGACPFCAEWETTLVGDNPQAAKDGLVVTPVQFRRHVGTHMEQLALFAIPRGCGEDGDAGNASNEVACGIGDGSSDRNSTTSSRQSYGKQKDSPLHVAAYEGLKDEVAKLLADGADVNAKGETWGTALHAAAAGGHIETFQLIIDNGVEIEEINNVGETALHLVADLSYLPMASVLMKLGASYLFRNRLGDSPAQVALRRGDIAMLMVLLERATDIELENLDGKTLLYVAAELGDTEIVLYLLEKGANAERQDISGKTPLFAAIRSRKVGIVRLLLDYGSDPNHQDFVRKTPLYAAAERGYFKTAQLLLERGADPNLKSDVGKAPLLRAAKHGHVEVAQLLLKSGADLCSKHQKGKSPIFVAARLGHKDVVQLFIDKGADPNSRTEDGKTPLFAAARRGHEKTVWLLIAYGADTEGRTNTGKTPLFGAASRGHEQIVRILLDKGAHPDTRTNDGKTPLLAAARHGHVELVRLLILVGAAVNVKDDQGRTPLSLAVERGHDDVSQLLLKAGTMAKTSSSAASDRGPLTLSVDPPNDEYPAASTYGSSKARSVLVLAKGQLADGCLEEARNAREAAAALDRFVEQVVECSAEIVGVISELFAISSVCGKLAPAINSSRFSQRVYLIEGDLSLALSSLSITLVEIFKKFKRLDITPTPNPASYRRVWREMRYMFREEGSASLIGRLELYRTFLLELSFKIEGLPPSPCDMNILRSNIQVIRDHQEPILDVSSRGPTPAQQDVSPSPFSLSTLPSSLSVPADSSLHWATKVFDGKYPGTSLKSSGKSSKCLGRNMATLGLTKHDSEVVDLMFDDDLNVRLVWDRRGNRGKVVCCSGWNNSGQPSFKSILELSALEITRAGSCIHLLRSGTTHLWANLKFNIYERMILFYCTFTSLRAFGPADPMTEQSQFLLAGEIERYGGEIEDGGYIHALRMFKDMDSGGVRLQASILNEEFGLKHSPIWTAFITKHVGSRSLLERVKPRVIRLKELRQYIFSHDYAPDRGGREEFELTFRSFEDAMKFEGALENIAEEQNDQAVNIATGQND